MNSPKTITSDVPAEYSTVVIDGVETPKVTYNQLSVTVRAADGIAGMRRQRVLYEQSRVEDSDQDSRLLRVMVYPDLIACSDSSLSFVEFAALPDEFIEKWKSACYELNPHWLDAGVGEKKVTT